MQITPAVLPENFEQLHDALFRLEGISRRVQIDLCDGVMGIHKTWLPYKEETLPHGFEYEFDLMVNDWQKYLARALSLGAKRVVMHVDDWEKHEYDILLEILKSRDGVSLGLSVSNSFNIEVFAGMVLDMEERYNRLFVQVMGISRIGAQGQPFDDSVLARIEYIRRNCRGVPIQVDGSMNPETIFLVKRSGATGVVVGSYIFGNKNIRKTVDSLNLSFGD